MKITSENELWIFTFRLPPEGSELFASYQSAIQSIDRYLWHGTHPGAQLAAMLRNDLNSSFACAGEDRRLAIFAILNYLYNDIPGSAWGSDERFRAWLELDYADRERIMGDRKRLVDSCVEAPLPEGE